VQDRTNGQLLAELTTDRRTAIVVLGMHRSGTSSVAGALSLLGAASPRTLMPAAEDNPKGFWESQVLMAFNDTVLAEGGSTWRDWRPFDLPGIIARRPDLVLEGRQRLQEEFADDELIVFKDPRVCRLFPLWETLLTEAGYRIVVVTPLRSPAEVAASLIARNAMRVEEAFRLWLRHVLSSERSSRGYPRAFVRWSDFLHDWQSCAHRLKTRLALNLVLDDQERARAVDEFLSAELRRQSPVPTAMPDWVRVTDQVLQRMALNGEAESDHDELDEMRWAFDQACVVFADAS